MNTSIQPFQYNDQTIRTEEDFLSLTDMWKANGSDPSKKPADWQRKEGKQFIEFIEEDVNVLHGHIEPIRTERGGKHPGTWAHWQIGLAYAKYLNHAFHAHCNTIIRAHIMQQPVPQPQPVQLDVRNLVDALIPLIPAITQSVSEAWARSDVRTQTIGFDCYQSILDRLKAIARDRAKADPRGRSVNHHLGVLDSDLRTTMNHARTWDQLHTGQWHLVDQILRQWERDVERQVDTSGKAAQLSLVRELEHLPQAADDPPPPPPRKRTPKKRA